MPKTPRPDLSTRPLTATCSRRIPATPRAVFAAWTDRFDLWFAQAGTVSMTPEAGRPWFFYNRDDWGRHPHYGRFLELVPERLVEMTWLTGNGEAIGTEGAETVLRIELEPDGDGTALRLTHSGFVSERSRDGHAENWPLALECLEAALRERE
ncbi:MAG: SRPBCC domain-containing protein [Planctomycetes bacterium]|nr:SRPBCC domain-containing protein [Planctomycetota bacterium]MCB9902871.1 SRPBCC domain-containing protein [Planctomycetota bacterium]